MNGFLRTRRLARFWSGRLQLQVYRGGGWQAAWNGWAFSLMLGSSPMGRGRWGWEISAGLRNRNADLSLIHDSTDHAWALVPHIDPA